MSQAFVQIPVAELEFLDRLSKNGLKLYLHLRKSFNRSTGQCNPSWESLGWARSKYYSARAELEKIGLCQFNGLNARFCSPRIPESQNPRIPESQNPGIPESETESPSFQDKTVRVSRIAYKEEPEEINQKNLNQSARGNDPSPVPEVDLPCPSWISEDFQAVLELPLSLYAQEQFALKVKNREAWQKVLQTWKLNRYSIRNLTGLIEAYEKEIAPAKGITNASPKSYQQQNFERIGAIIGAGERIPTTEEVLAESLATIFPNVARNRKRDESTV